MYFSGERGDLPLSAALHTPYNSLCSSTWHSQTECHSPIFPSSSLPHRYPPPRPAAAEEQSHRKRPRVQEEQQVQQYWPNSQLNHHQQQQYLQYSGNSASNNQGTRNPHFNGTIHRSGQEINKNAQNSISAASDTEHLTTIPRQARTIPRQYLMQVNGVQVTPLPSPTTLVFQGHFTAIEAESPVFMYQSDQSAPHMGDTRAGNSRNSSCMAIRRDAQTLPTMTQLDSTGNDGFVRTVQSRKPPGRSNSYRAKEIYPANNIARDQHSQCRYLKETVRSSSEYNPSCMFSKASSASKPDVKSVSQYYDLAQFWRISQQESCMDLFGTGKSTATNNNHIGKMDLTCLSQGGNDLPNIGSFLEYLEEL